MKKFSDLIETEKVDNEIKSKKQLYEQQLATEYIFNLKKELGLVNNIQEQKVVDTFHEETSESIKQDFPKPPTVDEVLNVLKEQSDELVRTQTKEKTDSSSFAETKQNDLISLSVEQITKLQKLDEKNSYQQPSVESPSSLNEIKRKLKFLEEWLSKVSLAGPGGGAGDIINLDMPTKLVTSDYTITRRDYYVGVNCIVKANITLPDPSTIVNGREVIIKDESGHAQLTPIKVIGTVDNDPNGFEIRINNGSVTLLYRDGWRIV